MRFRRAVLAAALTLVVMLALVGSQAAQAQTFTTLYTFTWNGFQTDAGYEPVGQPVVDGSGNIFGTTEQGGTYGGACEDIGCGTVWEYSSSGTLSVLHSFDYYDGNFLIGGVMLDKLGNVFGTTVEGGSYGSGTVFEIKSDGTFSTLYNFGAVRGDPANIWGGVVLDPSGNTYGMSAGGGAFGYGAVWEVSSNGVETVLHSFDRNDGANPEYTRLHRDSKGNLYGVTQAGGTHGYGVLFEVSSGGTFKVLHNFKGATDEEHPYGTLLDYKGSLYGTSQYAGKHGLGAVWRYNLHSARLQVLHSFSGADGSYPYSGVGCQRDEKNLCTGNLFGTTLGGGTWNYGTVWKIDSSGTFASLHSFSGNGVGPLSRPFVDKAGNLFGTTPTPSSDTGEPEFGAYGTLYEITGAKAKRRR